MIPVDKLIVGEVYIGIWNRRLYGFRYLGNEQWSSGNVTIHTKEWYPENKTVVNTSNTKRVFPLVHLTVFPEEFGWEVNEAVSNNNANWEDVNKWRLSYVAASNWFHHPDNAIAAPSWPFHDLVVWFHYNAGPDIKEKWLSTNLGSVDVPLKVKKALKKYKIINCPKPGILFREGI
jgi:hypothetical protein